MKWQLFILTLPERKLFLDRLLARLYPQFAFAEDQTQLVVSYSVPSLSLGENRQRMLDSATAEYCNFIDDDDLVAPDYIRTIYPLLNRDYVGFQLQMYMDRAKCKLAHHSLRYDSWHEDDSGFYRDISHLNPIRRELAMKAKFEGGVGEDHRWADAIRATGCVRTERFIPRPMYYYFCRSDKSAQAPEPWTSMVASSLGDDCT